MQYFGIATQHGIGIAVDNIAVSDSPDVVCTNGTCTLNHYEETTTTTTTEETTTTTNGVIPPPLPLDLIALGGGVAVVLIVLVAFLKRR